MTVQPKSIPAFSGSIEAAFADAKQHVEPRFVPQTLHADDRGYSLMNQLQGVMSPTGQVNYSVQYPGVVKAWHRHAKQTDFWICLHGALKVGIHDEGKNLAWMTVIGEHRPGVVIIPPPLWHGAATVGHLPAGLLYYVTHAYDPSAPDEQRRAADEPGGFPWQVQFR